VARDLATRARNSSAFVFLKLSVWPTKPFVIEPPETEAIEVTLAFAFASTRYMRAPSAKSVARCPPPDRLTAKLFAFGFGGLLIKNLPGVRCLGTACYHRSGSRPKRCQGTALQRVALFPSQIYFLSDPQLARADDSRIHACVIFIQAQRGLHHAAVSLSSLRIKIDHDAAQ